MGQAIQRQFDRRYLVARPYSHSILRYDPAQSSGARHDSGRDSP